MHTRIIVVFLSLVLLILPSAWGAERGALFKVSAKGNTMYLFGTIHVGRPDFFPLEPKIVAALGSASTLALELDPVEDKAAQAAMFMSQGLLTAPNSVENLPPEVKSRLFRVLATSQIDPAPLAEFKPWLIATVLALREFMAQGLGPQFGIDDHMAKLAKSAKVRVLPLESAEFQLKVFNRMSRAEQVSMLDESLKLIETGKQVDEVRQLVNAWASADKQGLDAFAERFAKDKSPSGQFMQKVFLDERNVGMADKLFILLGQERNTVAAIGTLHLIGDNSVPALLRARGVSVERIY